MLNPDNLMKRAQYSGFYKWLLNWALDRMVPFNRPHGFKVMEISKQLVTITIPYKRRNMNHIRGLHATALATLSEFTTGLLLLNALGIENYRLILQRLDIKYHYQGKMEASATFQIEDSWLENKVIKPLNNQESVVVPCPVEIIDVAGNQLTSATIYWQVKPWTKVKTRL
jgi:hypothetical protein